MSFRTAGFRLKVSPHRTAVYALRRTCTLPASGAEERELWETHDVADYYDLSKAVCVRFPNLKPSTQSIIA
ncbi:MAG TPA: hypothetical protein DCP92_01405 [Nitrospiraceae bacterium]|nr:hypothetical protein [Nitrospiraceae bacterium]